MTQQSPQQNCKMLLGGLQERDHNNILLHQQAATLATNGQLQPALRLLWSSIESAKRLNDDYVLGAARLYMAWTYFFAASVEEWERAAELCEKAVYHFEQQQAKHEQGIAQLTRGFIYEALCDAKHDRWTQGFRAFTDAFVLLRPTSEEFAECARQAYGQLGRKYVELGLAHEAEAQATESQAASANVDVNNQNGKTARANEPNSADATRDANQQTAETPSDAPPDTGANANASASASHQAHFNANTDSAVPPPKKEPTAEQDAAAASKANESSKTQKEAAKSPAHLPLGLLSTRLVLAHGVMFWTWISFLGLGVLGGSLAGLLLLALPLLWQYESNLVRYLIGGVIVGAGLALLALVILAGARQLWLRLPANQAAVLVERGRVWPLTARGVHWLIPFHQDVVAFVPTSDQLYSRFKHNVVEWDNRWLSAHIDASYRVRAPDLCWDRVLADLARPQALGLPAPLDLKTVQSALEKRAEMLIEQALLFVTTDAALRGQAANQRAFNAKVQEFLHRAAPADGIEFQTIEFSILLTIGDASF